MWSGASSLESGIKRASHEGDGTWTTVRAVSLSDVVERAGRIALLKIDAEGSEADILGATDALRLVDSVVGEYHEFLVPGVLGRVKQALAHADLDASVSRSRRFGPMFYASRT
jgi:hypothetical protein